MGTFLLVTAEEWEGLLSASGGRRPASYGVQDSAMQPRITWSQISMVLKLRNRSLDSNSSTKHVACNSNFSAPISLSSP